MSRYQSPYVIELDRSEVGELLAIERKPSAQQRLVQRVRIILLVADGMTNVDIAEQMGVCEDTVRKWRSRYCEN